MVFAILVAEQRLPMLSNIKRITLSSIPASDIRCLATMSFRTIEVKKVLDFCTYLARIQTENYTRITPACFHSRVQRVRMPGAPGIIRPAAVSWTDAAGAAVHMAQAASGAIPNI